MVKYRNTRLAPVIFVIIIAIVAIVALISVARAIFFPSTGEQQPTSKVDTSRESLRSTDQGRSVQMTVRGPIVANETFHSYQVLVSPTSRTLTTYKGYTSEVIDRVDLPNNSAAYEQFVYALDKANLAKGKQLTAENDDVRGVCATGRVFEFDVMQGSDSQKHLWTSTCDGSKGSLDANVSQLSGLFLKQIPDADKTIGKTSLGSTDLLQLKL